MSKQAAGQDDDAGREAPKSRPVRADAQRNTDALLEAALAVFATSGVDAPVREIAVRAGVGVGTVYRHFPQRSDLIAAVFRHEVDACADAAAEFAAEYEPGEALTRWLQRYATFIGTKRGLATALHSGDPAFDALPAYFDSQFRPALQSLLETAINAGEIRKVQPEDLLRAVANLCVPPRDGGDDHALRMIELLIDGLRYGAKSPTTQLPQPDQ
ncbi:TetR/AcrR family transcriptional regulator [Tolypothrix campylonemoides VB511288]|nr:TetR/AcrR family transcriptional regulator [Tolypothrix campylonemoides VB511288]